MAVANHPRGVTLPRSSAPTMVSRRESPSARVRGRSRRRDCSIGFAPRKETRQWRPSRFGSSTRRVAPTKRSQRWRGSRRRSWS